MPSHQERREPLPEGYQFPTPQLAVDFFMDPDAETIASCARYRHADADTYYRGSAFSSMSDRQRYDLIMAFSEYFDRLREDLRDRGYMVKGWTCR